MSVEYDGIKGYEYQYMATVYLSLLYIEKDEIKIYVEDKEDAKITFEREGECITLYFQSKQHSKGISLEDVGTWLGHFGNRQGTEFLLSRLCEKNSYSIFFSEGRCQDKVSGFVCNNNFENRSGISLNGQYISELREVLLNLYGNGGRI